MSDTVEKGFLKDIIQNPEDDTPRLVFADWLSENGEEQRADFIRVQCRIASLGGYGTCSDSRRGRASVGCGECELCYLCRRQDELATRDNFSRWFRCVAWWWESDDTRVAIAAGRCGVGACVTRDHPRYRGSFIVVLISRGWVEDISCPVDDWDSYGKNWIQLQPIRTYRPRRVPNQTDINHGNTGKKLLRNLRIGQLDTLDLSLLCQSAEELEQLRELHRYVRGELWQGLRRVILPALLSLSSDHREAVQLAWQAILPGVEIAFAAGLYEEQPS